MIDSFEVIRHREIIEYIIGGIGLGISISILVMEGIYFGYIFSRKK